VQNGVVIMMREPLSRMQTIALGQQSQRLNHHVMFASQGLKERAVISTKGAAASRTGIALLGITEHSNVASIHSAPLPACGIVAPLLFRSHGVSHLRVTYMIRQKAFTA